MASSDPDDATQSREGPRHGLIVACLRGDRDAWETLVRTHASLVYTVLRRYGLYEDEAADAFQEVWVAAWKGLTSVRDERALPGWLATIAARTGIRALRQRARGPHVGGERYEEVAARARDPAPPPDRAAVEREQGEAIRAAIRALPERDQRLVYAFFYDPTAPSYAAIAARLGVSPETVGPLRTRCLRRLRAALNEGPTMTGTEP